MSLGWVARRPGHGWTPSACEFIITGMRWGAGLLLFATQFGLAQQKIGYIEFFGYRDMNVAAIRRALPFREGDLLQPTAIAAAWSAVERATGRKPTGVDAVCCTARGERVVFIGLPGSSYWPYTFDPSPQGSVSLPPEIAGTYAEMFKAEVESAQRSLAEEGAPKGYRLLKDPSAQAAELAFRAFALGYEEEILKVLASSGDARQRAIAADALGFSQRNVRQIAALVRAARDPDPEVRNNVTRALVEILRAEPSAASQIPPDNFIEMLRSGTWTDRNKGSWLLSVLTQSRDPVLLRRIQSEAGDALLEMARWREFGWGVPARLILVRIHGEPDPWAYLSSAAMWRGAAVAAFLSALLVFGVGRFRSRTANWVMALLAPALISPVLYFALLRFAGSSDFRPGDEAILFTLPCYLAAAATATAAMIFMRVRRTGIRAMP